MDYRIVKEKAFEAVVKTRAFNDSSSTRGVPSFWSEYFAAGLEAKVIPDMGICEPLVDKGADWRYGIGCRKEYVAEIPEGFEVWKIPESTWAVFKCVGAMPKAIQDMWKRIFSEWLPQSKYELVQSYDFENYLDGDTGSIDYVSEIWVPVSEK